MSLLTFQLFIVSYDAGAMRIMMRLDGQSVTLPVFLPSCSPLYMSCYRVVIRRRCLAVNMRFVHTHLVYLIDLLIPIFFFCMLTLTFMMLPWSKGTVRLLNRNKPRLRILDLGLRRSSEFQLSSRPMEGQCPTTPATDIILSVASET